MPTTTTTGARFGLFDALVLALCRRLSARAWKNSLVGMASVVSFSDATRSRLQNGDMSLEDALRRNTTDTLLEEQGLGKYEEYVAVDMEYGYSPIVEEVEAETREIYEDERFRNWENWAEFQHHLCGFLNMSPNWTLPAPGGW